MKDAIIESYGHKGDKIVNMNMAAVDAGLDNIKEIAIPESWRNPEPDASTEPIKTDRADLDKYINDIMIPANSMRGDSIPVSAFMSTADGHLPQGTAAFEKRGIAVDVPRWIPENCIQCNQCSYVCPHAAIRPFAFSMEELKNAPAGTVTRNEGKAAKTVCVMVSPLDCKAAVLQTFAPPE